jgi:hypothetical protein
VSGVSNMKPRSGRCWRPCTLRQARLRPRDEVREHRGRHDGVSPFFFGRGDGGLPGKHRGRSGKQPGRGRVGEEKNNRVKLSIVNRE